MSDALIQTAGACGRITLNRPRAINALSVDMVRIVTEALLAWIADPAVHFVLVDGAGDRGLCSGGDIRAMRTMVSAGELEQAGAFFSDEYRLNYLIAHYPKPYIALMDGVVMGGGIGIAGHATHRIVTERSVIAMPETTIGFIPDAGGSHLLGIAAGELGTYYGLTGNRFGAAEAIALGFADSLVPSEQLPALTDELEQCRDAAEMECCLARFITPAGEPECTANRGWIDTCFAGETVEAIEAALAQQTHPQAALTLAELGTRSPTSLRVTLRALRNTRLHHDLAYALRQEYCIALAAIRAHDFLEGVRAAVVDRDRAPQWQPQRLGEVSEPLVARHFATPGSGELDLSFYGLRLGDKGFEAT